MASWSLAQTSLLTLVRNRVVPTQCQRLVIAWLKGFLEAANCEVKPSMKTPFCTRQGLWQFTVMYIEFGCAMAIFECLMESGLRSYSCTQTEPQETSAVSEGRAVTGRSDHRQRS